MLNLKWDLRYLEIAKLVSGWSKDPSTKTGAVIVDKNNCIKGVGYNGFARKVIDCEERLNNRPVKYEMVVHCEVNAAISVKSDLSGCTLYTWPFQSCSRCAAQMIQYGISRVVAPENDNPRWQESFALSTQQFREAGVDIVLYDCNTLVQAGLLEPVGEENANTRAEN